MYDTLSKFMDVYNKISFTITNHDLSHYEFGNEKTGLIPFVVHTTTPFVVTPKTPTNPTA